MSACGCGCGGSVHKDIVTELISAGVATTVRGAYDDHATYAYGDMVTGSDGKNYVYLCQTAQQLSTGVAPSVTAPTGPGPTTGTTTPTATTGTDTLPTGFVRKGSPALFLTQTVPGFPVTITAGTSFMEIFHLASEPPLYPTRLAFPDHAQSSNVFAIAEDTGEVYYSTGNGWVDMGAFVGEDDGISERDNGHLNPARASIVVRSYADLAGRSEPVGQRYLVASSTAWEVVAKV